MNQRWRRWFGGGAAPEAPAHEMPAATPIGEVAPRTRASVAGKVTGLGVNPTTGWFEAELVDGSGRVRLIWMGRSRVRCIEEGMRMRVEGMLAERDGERIIYNPAFDVLPG